MSAIAPVLMLSAALGIWGIWLPGLAQADDFQDYQHAREPYDEGNYGEAVTRLEHLVGGTVPRLTDPIYIQESRKLLGASYLFVSREADAERQFALLVRAAPSQTMEAPDFSAHVVEVFQRVRARILLQLENEAAAVRRAEEERRLRELEAILRDRRRIEGLTDLAQNERVILENSRYLAVIPFGVGQFQNEKDALGIFFAVTEVALIGAAIGTYVAWDSLDLPDLEPDDPRLEPFIDREEALRIANQVLFGVAVGTILAGLLEAQLNFVPGRVTTRERELPPELLPPDPPVEVQVGVSPFGADVTVRF